MLDLRGNGGGDFDESLRMANLFLKRGQDIVTVRSRSTAPVVSRALEQPIVPDAPLVVLTDGYTASASEIVAGALQDHDRGVIIGTTSFGKGLVQSLFTLEGGWGLKMTTGKWYTPSGRSIQRERKLLEDGRLVEVVPDSLETDSVRKARPAFKSDGGRVVYGGGGITPDVIIPSDTITDAQQIVPQGVGAEVAGELPRAVSHGARAEGRWCSRSSPCTPTWRDSVYARLTRAGVQIDRPEFDAAHELIDRDLERRVASMAFGDSAAFRRTVSYDTQLRACRRPAARCGHAARAPRRRHAGVAREATDRSPAVRRICLPAVRRWSPDAQRPFLHQLRDPDERFAGPNRRLTDSVLGAHKRFA